MAKNDAVVTDAQATAQAAVPTPEHHLVVIHPFGNYSKGDRITDANDIATVLAGENARSCNKSFPV